MTNIKVLVELPTWLGDCVMATPAIEAVIDLYPNADITVLGSSVSVETMLPHPHVVAGVVLDKSYFTLPRTARSLGAFDLFLSFRSSKRSSVLKFFVKAKQKYQFDKKSYPQGHQVEKYVKFVSDGLGVELSPRSLKLYAQGVDKGKRPRLGINPGASYGSAKRWYPEEFVKVAKQLSDQYDIVIFGGPSEQEMASDIEKGLIELRVDNYQNLAGKTSVSELIGQISSLDLFITGDSGPMHVAAAFQVPTVAIFGPTKDKETSQWMNQCSAIVKKGLDCQPCMQRTCPLKHHNCMRLIQAEDVLEAVKRL